MFLVISALQADGLQRAEDVPRSFRKCSHCVSGKLKMTPIWRLYENTMRGSLRISNRSVRTTADGLQRAEDVPRFRKCSQRFVKVNFAYVRVVFSKFARIFTTENEIPRSSSETSRIFY